MESKDRWVDAGYDGESKQEKCQYAEQTKGWSLAGRKLSTPASTLKSVVPLMSPKGCFHAAAKVVDSVVEGERVCIPAVIAQSLSTCLRSERQEQQASELPLHGEMISSLVMLLRTPPFFLIRMLFTTLPALLLIVNLITLTICKVAAWSVCYDTSAEWKRWMGTIEIRFDSITY